MYKQLGVIQVRGGGRRAVVVCRLSDVYLRLDLINISMKKRVRSAEKFDTRQQLRRMLKFEKQWVFFRKESRVVITSD